jgi:hypothetical protein
MRVAKRIGDTRQPLPLRRRQQESASKEAPAARQRNQKSRRQLGAAGAWRSVAVIKIE